MNNILLTNTSVNNERLKKTIFPSKYCENCKRKTCGECIHAKQNHTKWEYGDEGWLSAKNYKK